LSLHHIDFFLKHLSLCVISHFNMQCVIHSNLCAPCELRLSPCSFFVRRCPTCIAVQSMCVPSRGFLFCRKAERIKQKQQQEKGEREVGKKLRMMSVLLFKTITSKIGFLSSCSPYTPVKTILCLLMEPEVSFGVHKNSPLVSFMIRVYQSVSLSHIS
jgi:hypothetical protein